MDRAGLVGEDGQTHMGLYDIAYMLAVPGMTVAAPKDARTGRPDAAALAMMAPFSSLSTRQGTARSQSGRQRRGRSVWHLGYAPPGSGVAILGAGTMRCPRWRQPSCWHRGIDAAAVNARS